jgi:hypothetical protein
MGIAQAGLHIEKMKMRQNIRAACVRFISNAPASIGQKPLDDRCQAQQIAARNNYLRYASIMQNTFNWFIIYL